MLDPSSWHFGFAHFRVTGSHGTVRIFAPMIKNNSCLKKHLANASTMLLLRRDDLLREHMLIILAFSMQHLHTSKVLALASPSNRNLQIRNAMFTTQRYWDPMLQLLFPHQTTLSCHCNLRIKKPES